MLFNSYEFIFVFLPIVLAGFFLLGQWKREVALAWLFSASLFFYAWFKIEYLPLIVGSLAFNYGISRAMVAFRKKPILIIGITGNLLLLAYYKYAHFLVENVNQLSGSQYHFEKILLPLAISFFTFQQIAYLVDTWRHEADEHHPLHYGLFVTFFPQLIAGPIVHHKEVIPQFSQPDLFKFRADHVAVGLTIFCIGLFKKLVLADQIGDFATPVFAGADEGQSIQLIEAWVGALSYTFQLYFDFSGYADMAIGSARMFGIRLPLNFNSPYKAVSIIEFWRRWHITLSRFLRDYLYIPLGGNRKGPAVRHVNLVITMLLGGLWHGAGWNFVIWGGLHGLYLIINHALVKCFGEPTRWITRGISWATTFLAVVVGWVFFRATTLGGASGMLKGMFGMNGLALPRQLGGSESIPVFSRLNAGLTEVALWLFLVVFIAFILPNTQAFMQHFTPALDAKPNKQVPGWLRWKPSLSWAIFTGVLFVVALNWLSEVSEFLYFNF